MSENKTPVIQPIKLKEFDTKQSKYGMVPHLPFRSVILGPSGSGKTILLQNMILDIYRNCCSRIYIFSPSINVDMTWEPVKHYIEKEMKVQHTKEEPIYFDHYDPESLQRIIDTQHKVIEYQKKQDHKKLFSIMVVIDDFADDPKFSRHSKILHALYTTRESQLHQHHHRYPEVCSDRTHHKSECHGALRVSPEELQGPGDLRGRGVRHN
jgi:ABC-type glutathione transport system ATPase component